MIQLPSTFVERDFVPRDDHERLFILMYHSCRLSTCGSCLQVVSHLVGVGGAEEAGEERGVVERGGEGGAEGGGGGISSLRTRAHVPTGEASAAGERRRAFFARSHCICSPPCSCGGNGGGGDDTGAGGGGGGASGGRCRACPPARTAVSSGASGGGCRTDCAAGERSAVAGSAVATALLFCLLICVAGGE